MINNNKKIRVLLYAGFKDNTIFYSAVSPPLGLYRLRHYLEKRNIHCDVHDLSLHDNDFKDTKEKISNGYYDVVGVSVDSEKMGRYFTLLKDIRERAEKIGKKVMIVCGGQGGAHAYKSFIQKGNADGVLLGFAESNFHKLILNFAQDPNQHISIYAKGIYGIAYPRDKEFDRIQKIPTRPLTDEEFVQFNYHEIKDLFIPYHDYWYHTQEEGAAALNLNEEKIVAEADPHCDMPINKNTQKFYVETIRLYTSSHCPWKCGFCSSHSFLRMSQASVETENKIPVAPKSGAELTMNSLATTGSQPHPVYRITPAQIYDIIKIHCDKYQPKVFLFNDDAFWDGSKPGFQHIIALCDLIIEGKEKDEIDKEIIFNCQAKIGDFILKENGKRKLHNELIVKLKKAGFYHFGTGVETFAERLLRVPSINKKGNVSEADQHMVIKGLLKHGFSPSVNIILFVPEQTLEELFHTMRTATEYMLEGIQIAMTPLLRPQSGSGILELIDKGLTTIKARYSEWIDPETKEVFKYPLYCIPEDPKIAAFIEHFDIKDYEGMVVLSSTEQEKIVKKSGWSSQVVPRPVTALSVFISLSKYMGKDDWVQYFEDAVYEILARQNLASNKSELIENTIMSNT